ncbi:zinc finger protein [Angomonas deanei]|nr:zinc finger protein [Angomonas deanei]|eukprot:EPY40725.1 zinc finger protein [Angomonas deanei]
MTVPESPSKPLRNREQRRGVTIPKYPSESPIVAMGTSTGGTLEFREGHFPCELCGKCYPSELILLQHLEGHLDPAKKEVSQYHREKAAAEGAQTQSFALVCDLCPVSKKVYNLPSSLFAHIRFKTPSRGRELSRGSSGQRKCKSTEAFPCALCGKVFPTAAALESHTVGKHKETNNPVVPGEQWWCNLCEKGFLTSSALLSHLSSKHRQPLERFPCPACKRVFSDRFSLRAHISQSHAELDVPEVISATEIRCNKCNKLFLDHQGLHDHEVRHHHKDPRLPAKSFEGASIVRQAVVRQLKRSGAKKEEKPQP